MKQLYLLLAFPLVAMGALSRQASIGVHFRDDCVDSVDDAKHHLTITRNESGTVPHRTEVQSNLH